jgi:hypothetical protein
MAKEMEEVVVRARRPGFSSNAPRGGGGGISGSGFNTSNYFGGDPSFLSSEALLEDFDPTPDFSDRRRLRDRIADRVNQARENYPIATKAIELAAGSTALGQAVGGINLAKKVVNKMQDKEKKAMGGMMYNKGSLVGNQSLLDKNNDGDITGEDFKMLRTQKVLGGLLNITRAGSKAVAKSLLSDATKEVKKISKQLPSVQEQKKIQRQYENPEDRFGDIDVEVESGIDNIRRDNNRDIEVLENFFSNETELAKRISELKKTIYKRIKDKDVADQVYRDKLADLQTSIFNNKSFKSLEREQDALIRSLPSEEQFGLSSFANLAGPDSVRETEFLRKKAQELDPRFEEFGAFKEDLEPLTEAQKRRNAKEMERIKNEDIPFNKGGRVKYQEGSLMMPPEMESDMPVDTYPNIPPEEMAEAEASQLPDAAMEDQYMNFVLDQSLDDDEQSYLMNALETDPKLSQIFDKVITTASEFTGAGEVEGPGTGVSDSIPARLSDGEFVFTKKATDQMGADNLQMMMDDAERAFDGGMMRSPKQEGGMMYKQKDEDPLAYEKIAQDEIKKNMLRANRAPSLLGGN